MFKRKGGGVKGFLNNVKKNCTFFTGWLPLFSIILFFLETKFGSGTWIDDSFGEFFSVKGLVRQDQEIEVDKERRVACPGGLPSAWRKLE